MAKSHIDKEGRIIKAKKIISILKEYKELRKCRILDIGIGTGAIANELAKIAKSVDGVDVIDKVIAKKKFKFKLIKDSKLPFKNKSFDIVVSNHVLEHIHNQEEHLNEIKRVLKDDGICYLATPNKYWFFERHFRLPFLSFFPNRISKIYLKILKDQDYDIELVSFPRLKRILMGWGVSNITTKILKNPKKYHAQDISFSNLSSILGVMPDTLLDKICFFLPSFVFILNKKKE